MYLKEVKAKGFKSFADLTNIELNNNLTGIVGPNGSGKSNVVDAVRWVLGEQSVKSLRGAGAMTDVIFSGSKSRKAASSATVTLVFDNSDAYLNTPFEEVVVKRQLFNTGESDYYLNGTKCRLKDITDLLIDTGIGRESFNIIGQGAIDQIISTKADERRVIFEEAAGVLKYKKRKEKALHQLDKTHQNLNRVNDVILELEEQLEPLSIQAEVAREYLDLKDELRYLEISLTAYDINKLNTDYTVIKNDIDKYTSEIDTIDTSFLTEETDLLNYKNELAILNEKWHAANQKLIIKTKDLEKIKAEKQLVIERTKYQQNDQSLEQVLKLKEELAKLNQTSNHYKNDLTNLNHDLTKNKDLRHNYQHNINELNETINKLKQKFSVDQQKLMQLKSRHLHLETNISEGGSLNSSVKNVLNNKNLTGIHHCTAKLLYTDNKYANVINTSLGATSQYIIVENEESAKKAINYLRINELGRATFLPLTVIEPKVIKTDDLNKIVHLPGFVDIALNLISFDPKYYPVYANLLGNTIVAKTIDDANQISNLLNKRYRVVTLEGDLVNIGGSLTGGKYKITNGLIHDQFELEQTKAQMLEYEASVKDQETIIEHKQKELNDITNLLVKANESNIHLDHLINHKRELINELEDKAKQTNGELKTLSALIDGDLLKLEENLINEYYKCEADVNNLNTELNTFNKKVEELTITINELEHSIKNQNTTFNKLQQQLKEAEINGNRIEVRLDYLLNYLNEEYTITYEKAILDYPLKVDAADARVSVNKLKHNIKKLGDVNTGAIEEYNRVNDKYTFLNTQREDLLKAETTILEIISDMDKVMKETFSEVFNKINHNFKEVFKVLFGGGEANLILTNPDDMLTTGIEIEALPPGKKLMHISLLSGGEKTLTAISLLFAILNTKTVPFCILDEVEAALDEANVVRFCKYLQTYLNKTQFLVITHKKQTMEYVNNLYGITMQEAGVSKLVSVKLSD